MAIPMPPNLTPYEICKVFVETPDGLIWEFDAYTSSISINSPIDGALTYEIILNGSSAAVKTNKANLLEKRKGSEWECSHCKRPNHREKEVCESCGSVRSFIYD